MTRTEVSRSLYLEPTNPFCLEDIDTLRTIRRHPEVDQMGLKYNIFVQFTTLFISEYSFG